MRLAARFLSFASAAVLSLMVACGGSTSSPPPAPAEPQITSFTADKTIITYGDAANLTAVYTNGVGTLSPGGGAIPSGQTVAVQPKETTTYVLTVTNTANATTSRTVTVKVEPVPTATLEASKTSIVVGESVQLKATFSSGTASVTNNVNATAITPVSGVPFLVSPTATTAYTLTITNAAGAKATAGVIINVQNAAVITSFSANPTIITQGGTATLNYAFSGGTGFINNGVGPVASGLYSAVSPLVTTTYLLTVSNSAGSSAVSAVTVTVAGRPANVSLFAERGVITVGDSVRLTANFGSGTAVITNNLDGTTINPISGVPITVTPTGTVSYILTVTNAAGDSASAVTTVTVVPLPTITAFYGSPSTITRGSSCNLMPLFVGGTGSINNGIGPVQPGVAVPVSPVVTTPYLLTVTNAAGAFIQMSTTVDVVEPPTGISLVAVPPIITIGNSTRLIGNFASGTAVVDHGVGSVLNGVPNLVTPPVTTTYTMTVINPAGAAATTGTVVTVVPPPSITGFTSNPGTPPPVAGGSPVQLLPVFINGSGYIGGVGTVVSGQSYTVNPIETTTYTLTVTNPAGDAVTRILTVHVVGDPRIDSFITFPTTITAGEFAQLIGIFSGGNGVITGGTLPVGGTPVVSGVSLFVNPAVTTTYTLTVTNSAMVSVNRSVTVIVVGAPTALGLTSTIVPTAPPAATVPITAGETTYLYPTWTTATGGTSGVITPNVGAVLSGSFYAVQPTQTTTYTLTVTNSVGFKESFVHTVVVLTGPNAAALTSKPEGITLGKSAYLTAFFTVGTGGTATVSGPAGSYTGAELPLAYPAGTLQNAVPFPVLPTAIGTHVYTLSATNSNGITSTHGTTVTVYPAPTAALAITAGSPNPITLGQTTSITPTFSGGTGVISGIGPVTSGQDYPVTPATTTTYVLTVTNPVGDTATASLTITVVQPPTIDSFTATPSSIAVGDTSQLIGIFSGGTGVITGGTLPVGGVTVANGASLAVTPIVDTTYVLTVTNSAAVSVSRSVTVLVAAVPVATGLVASVSPITVGETSYLTPTFSGGEGVVTPGVGPVVSGTAYAVNPTETTTYTLSVSNSIGTTRRTTADVVVLTGPNAAALTASPAGVTLGSSTYLTAYFTVGTGGTATVDGPAGSFTTPVLPALPELPAAYPAGTLLQAVPFPVTPTAAGTYVYTLTVTNSNGVTSTHGVTVHVYDTPTAALAITALSKNPIIAGETTSITPTFTNGTGVIEGIGTVISGQDYPVSPAVTTTYVLTVTNPAGEVRTASRTVTVLAGPMASAFYFQPSTISLGGTTQLYALFNNATGAAVTHNGSAAPDLTPASGFAITSGTPVTVTSPLATAAPGIYTFELTVTNSATTPATTYTTTTNLTVVPAPTATLAVTTAPAGPPYVITAGGNATLTPTFTGGTGTITGIGPVTSGVAYVVAPTVSTNYTLTVTSSAGVEATATQTVFVIAGPFAQALSANPMTITLGDSTYLTAVFNPIGSSALVLSTSVGAPTAFSTTPVNGVPFAVTPTTIGTKIYGLEVGNGLVSHTTGVTVNVVAAPAVTVFSAVSSDVPSGGTLFYPGDNVIFTITYTDGGTDTNGVFTDVLQGASSTVASGQTVVTSIPLLLPAGTTLTYTLKVTNAAGTSVVVPVTITLS